jgi:hypothetical protein
MQYDVSPQTMVLTLVKVTISPNNKNALAAYYIINNRVALGIYFYVIPV